MSHDHGIKDKILDLCQTQLQGSIYMQTSKSMLILIYYIIKAYRRGI